LKPKQIIKILSGRKTNVKKFNRCVVYNIFTVTDVKIYLKRNNGLKLLYTVLQLKYIIKMFSEK